MQPASGGNSNNISNSSNDTATTSAAITSSGNIHNTNINRTISNNKVSSSNAALPNSEGSPSHVRKLGPTIIRSSTLPFLPHAPHINHQHYHNHHQNHHQNRTHQHQQVPSSTSPPSSSASKQISATNTLHQQLQPSSSKHVFNSDNLAGVSSRLRYPTNHRTDNFSATTSSLSTTLGQSNNYNNHSHQLQHSRRVDDLRFQTLSNNDSESQFDVGIANRTAAPISKERDAKETVTVANEAFEGFSESELDKLRSLKKELPVELSFVLSQQAYCLAKMNFLDRQVKELKEATKQMSFSQPNQQHQHQNSTQLVNQPPYHGHIHQNQRAINGAGFTKMASTSVVVNGANKNGNFMLSDDSGGEYSRATISDDDELSSLLDQIAKSVKSERSQPTNMSTNSNNNANQSIIANHQQHRPSLSMYTSNNPTQQQYAIFANPNQLHPLNHHPAVPVFVMSSPIAVAAPHQSSISSNVLPGVHFQPEPRYNQYYEDFYVQSSSSSSNTATNTMMRHGGGSNNNINGAVLANNNGGLPSCAIRSHQFDNSISAIEQLVNQKEKRQIKSQLKSADNWLKMRTSGASILDDDPFGAGSTAGNIRRKGSITSGVCIIPGGAVSGNATGGPTGAGARAGSMALAAEANASGATNLPSSPSSSSNQNKSKLGSQGPSNECD